MDDSLARELFKVATKAGAEDVAVVSNNTWKRIDRIASDSKSQSIENAQENSCVFYAAVGDAECTADITDGLDLHDLQQIVIHAAKAAKLANIWGTSQKHQPFDTKFQKVSPQNCTKSVYDLNRKQSSLETCVQSGKSGTCLNDLKENPAPALEIIAGKIRQQAPQLKYYLSQEITESDTEIWLPNGFQRAHSFKTALTQKLQTAQGKIYRLPDYVFDGAGIYPDDSWHTGLLSADVIAQKLSDAIENSLDFSQYDGFGIVLSPWSMAVLAHESRHLNLDMTVSGKIVLDVDSCLFSPPVPATACRGFSLNHAGNRKSSLNLLFARTSSKSVILDVPVRWMRRGHTLDVEFAYIAEVIDQKIARYYQPVTIRFELDRLWQNCTETAEPPQRMAFGCIGGHVVIQSIWAYFACRTQSVPCAWPSE